MLTADSKRHIDAARQVLVGKIPDPKSQVQEITNALIYKFMDDMDELAASVGGKRRYFTGEYEKYSWRKIMDPKVGAFERIGLYTEALARLSKNSNLPELFRSIFEKAYLPFNDGRTLTLFLQEVDYFNYKNSEELGNAYEYLLSIMGSQGDAGQFRTPRHIIDFIVKVIDPGKNDSLLDPACGTAGFLISAYKHVISKHDGVDENGKPTSHEKALTADEKKRLYANYHGFDIDDNMVKMAKVNMYLHSFPDPKIIVHDTLSSEDFWNNRYDVMFANPPFMTPKGGIQPHSKFSVQSNRSEVLFVDYIITHLKPTGRAGIIVPEGIIFQSGKSYKELRKNLVNDGLYAVVSLPSGVFAPYSGVKTSILLFDNELAKKSQDILFVKITADGFDLGAQRRIVIQNDLPIAEVEILSYQNYVHNNKVTTPFTEIIKHDKAQFGDDLQVIQHDKFSLVSKTLIKKNGDYNLSGERYRVATDYTNAKWPMIELGKVCDLYQPKTITSKEISAEYKNGWYKVFGANGVIGYYHTYNEEYPEVLLTCRGATCGTINLSDHKSWVTGNAMVIHPKDSNQLIKKYLYYLLKNADFSSVITGAAQPQVTRQSLSPLQIPLPPIEIQKQIVKELCGNQQIIYGAKKIVSNWKPKIEIDPKWEKVTLGEACDVRDGTHDSPKQVRRGYPLITSKNIRDGQLDFSNISYISEEDFKKVSQRSYVDIGDIIMPMIGTIGGACLIKSKKTEFAIKNVALFKKSEQIIPEYLLNVLDSDLVMTMFENQSTGATQKFVSLGVLRGLEIPLPSLKTQNQIVEKIEVERSLVESAKKLIEIYEKKTKHTLDRLWEQH